MLTELSAPRRGPPSGVDRACFSFDLKIIQGAMTAPFADQHLLFAGMFSQRFRLDDNLLRSKWDAKPLRRRGARLPAARSRPLLTCALIPMPASISSKAKTCCSSSTLTEPSFSNRRPTGRGEDLQDLREYLLEDIRHFNRLA
ncbi:hypothetical protein GGD64_008450 [Bradyrhizobium sp. CIR3A]|nr:hypothetical protein [Bradyrhizobium sp. CIR3A]